MQEDDDTVEALRRLVQRTPGGRHEVAAAIHANEQTLYQILQGVALPSGRQRTVGRDLRERLDRRFPGWRTLVASETLPNAWEKSAQPDLFQNVLVIPWDNLMAARLDGLFCVEMPDDSMAPRLRPGKRLFFDTHAQPRPGDAVLIVDHLGNHFVRVYKQRRPGSWQAHALNDAFQELDSERDALAVRAVLVGEYGGWV